MGLAGKPDDGRFIRIDQVAPGKGYRLDSVKGLSEIKSRAIAEARRQSPHIKRQFLHKETVPFKASEDH